MRNWIKKVANACVCFVGVVLARIVCGSVFE